MRTAPIWVRLVGAVVLLGMVLGAALIVGRDSGRPGGSGDPKPPRSAESIDEPGNTAFPAPFTAADLEKLETCIGTDAEAESRPLRARLARRFRVIQAPFDQSRAQADLVEIASQVQRLRGLRFRRRVEVRFVSDRGLQRLFLSLPGGDAERRRGFLFATGDLLGALGAVQAGASYGVDQFYNPVVRDVAGFYADNGIAAIVPTDKNSFGTRERAIIAHELEHALSDQVFGLPTLSGSNHPVRDGDGHSAAAAVVEGSAQVLQGRFEFSQPGFLPAPPFALGVRRESDEFSYYLARSGIFPYTEGVKFVCELHESGGWRAVNEAFEDPPGTTLEVLYPEIYLSGYEPPSLRPASPPGRGWDLELSSTFGAADWMLLFQAPGNNPGFGIEDARALVRDWAAGHVSLWRKGDFVAIAIVGETTLESGMCAAIEDWYESAFELDESSPGEGDMVREWYEPSVQDTALTCPGSEIRLGIGPNVRVARRIVR